MPYGERVGNFTGTTAECDKLFEQSVFNGTSGTLSIGMPVFKDLTDAGEFNARYAATALVPAVGQSGGKVVLATDVRTNVNAFMGVYAPFNPADRPNNGDVIRLLIYGEGIVSAISQTGNANALAVGSLLTVLATQTSAVGNGNTVSPRQTIGLVLATLAALTVGSTPAGGAAGGNVAMLVNAFVTQS